MHCVTFKSFGSDSNILRLARDAGGKGTSKPGSRDLQYACVIKEDET